MWSASGFNFAKKKSVNVALDRPGGDLPSRSCRRKEEAFLESLSLVFLRQMAKRQLRCQKFYEKKPNFTKKNCLNKNPFVFKHQWASTLLFSPTLADLASVTCQAWQACLAGCLTGLPGLAADSPDMTHSDLASGFLRSNVDLRLVHYSWIMTSYVCFIFNWGCQVNPQIHENITD